MIGPSRSSKPTTMPLNIPGSCLRILLNSQNDDRNNADTYICNTFLSYYRGSTVLYYNRFHETGAKKLNRTSGIYRLTTMPLNNCCQFSVWYSPTSTSTDHRYNNYKMRLSKKQLINSMWSLFYTVLFGHRSQRDTSRSHGQFPTYRSFGCVVRWSDQWTSWKNRKNINRNIFQHLSLSEKV